MPIIGWGIAVSPPLRTNLVVGILGRNIPCVLNGNLACDGRKAFDGGSDGIVEGAGVVSGMANDIETVALVVAFPLLLADVEGDAGRVDGDIRAYWTSQLLLDDAADLCSVLGGSRSIEHTTRCRATFHELATPRLLFRLRRIAVHHI